MYNPLYRRITILRWTVLVLAFVAVTLLCTIYPFLHYQQRVASAAAHWHGPYVGTVEQPVYFTASGDFEAQVDYYDEGGYNTTWLFLTEADLSQSGGSVRFWVSDQGIHYFDGEPADVLDDYGPHPSLLYDLFMPYAWLPWLIVEALSALGIWTFFERFQDDADKLALQATPVPWQNVVLQG